MTRDIWIEVLLLVRDVCCKALRILLFFNHSIFVKQSKMRETPSIGSYIQSSDSAISQGSLMKISCASKNVKRMFSELKKPRGAFPPQVVLPSWENWPLSQKLPQLPIQNGKYWSRGGLGEPLKHMPMKNAATPAFTFENQSKLPYDLLHDPALSRYLHKPSVIQQLRRNDLIDENEFVKCSQQEQNEYRAFLHAALKTEIETQYKNECDERKEYQELIRKQRDWAFLQYQWNATIQRAKDAKEQERKLAKFKYLENELRCQAQLQSYKLAKEQRRLELKEINLKNLAIHQQLKSSSTTAINAFIKGKIEMKQIWAEENKLEHFEKIKMERNRKKKCNWETRLASLKRKDEISEWAKNTLVQERNLKVAQRQAMVIKQRQRMPLIRQKRILAEKRSWDLARKYGMIWLNKVRERLRIRLVDDSHSSSFDNRRELDGSIKELEQMAGIEHDKLTNVLFQAVGGRNVKSWIKRIKQTLEDDDNDIDDDTDAD